MLTVITISLIIAALYSGGMYAFLFVQVLRGRFAGDREFIENHTFHLGLCFILAVGFLGLLEVV